MESSQSLAKNIDSETLKKSNILMVILISCFCLSTPFSFILTFGRPGFVTLLFSIILGLAPIGLIIQDNISLTKNNVKMCSIWWSLLAPVYLWKRANILGVSKDFFWHWIVIFVTYNLIVMVLVVEFRGYFY